MQGVSLINILTDREAMGLTETFQVSRLEGLADIFQRLKHYSVSELLSMTESSRYLLRERYVAGQVLALYGDPRIITTLPVMIPIPAARVETGISVRSVEAVLKEYSQVGLQESWILKETPPFQAEVASFHIRKYLVTHQEYRDFLLETDYPELPTSWEFGMYPIHKANHPVYTVTEVAAEAYALWISTKTGRSFRLPTEIEWEYAASGPLHFEYPWGHEFESDCANTIESQIYASTPVGIFPKGYSPFGVADMAGNVEEYVADEYKPYPGGPFIEDDLMKSAPNYRVCRGGSFTRYADLTRTTRRHGAYKKNIYVLGFRLVEVNQGAQHGHK